MKRLLLVALVSLAVIILSSVVAATVYFLIESSNQIHVTKETTSTTEMVGKPLEDEK